YFAVRDVVLPGQTISSTGFERRGGGKGANQAAAVAQAGGIVQLLGAVGEDGDWLVKDLKDMGVRVDYVQTIDDQEPTGRAIIQLTSSGENCIILHKGANYARNDPPEERRSLLSSAQFLLLQNEIPFATTTEYLKDAADRGIQVVYNPSPMPSDNELRAFPWPSITYLLINEGEAQTLIRAFNADAVSSASSTVRALSSLLAFSATTIVCTLGGSGVLAAIPGTLQQLYIPASSLQGTVRDTTGAGDCFTGYFVAGLMRLEKAAPISLHDAAELLRFSAQAAGMCVEKRGALESIPKRAEVEERIA
ncbi:Ribokinase-like protein, partial [Vararia minispora EC-137]